MPLLVKHDKEERDPDLARCPPDAQVDVTSKTEGRAFSDATGVPLLVKYDTRLRENVAKRIVDDVTVSVQVRARVWS